MDETQNVGTSMREYIQVVDSDMGANNAPISVVPADMLNTRVTQIVNALRELHAISANGAIDEAMMAKLDQACGLILDVATTANQPQQEEQPEEFVEESAPTTPEAMAPSVDQQGHRSYATPSGSSYAQRKGFTG